MANCKVETNEVPVTTYVEQKVVTLELSHEEAMTLSLVLAKVGGCPFTTPRRYTESIYRALVDENYNFVAAEKMLGKAVGNLIKGDIAFSG